MYPEEIRDIAAARRDVAVTREMRDSLRRQLEIADQAVARAERKLTDLGVELPKSTEVPEYCAALARKGTGVGYCGTLLDRGNCPEGSTHVTQ